MGGVVSLMLIVVVSLLAETSYQMEVVRDNTVRLHILANSNSQQDQAVKLQVRDALLEESENWFEDCNQKQDVLDVLQQRQDDIADICRQTLQQLNCQQDVTVSVDNEWFDTRDYTEFCMPCGNYDCIKIELGAGAGHNWWCVLYPQLCIASAGSIDAKDSYGENGVRVIDSENITRSFKIVDWFYNLVHLVGDFI